MSKRALYTYEDLERMRVDFKPNKSGITPFTLVNAIYLLFPVEGRKGVWGCKCFCGNYFKANFNRIRRKSTKSCGCINGNRGRINTALKSFILAKNRSYTVIKLPSENKSRDMILKCNSCNFINNRANFSEHLQEGRKFCRCSKTFKGSLEDIIVSCKDYEINSTWNIIKFEKEFVSKRSFRISLKCSLCDHEVAMTYSNFVRGKGCRGCADNALGVRKSKDLSYFLEKAVEKHGGRYDYSKVVYKKCREPVTIICPDHGEFKQSPDNHYNKGEGCPRCKSSRLQHVHFHKSRVEENRQTYLNLPSSVYVMKVGKYIKIGLSVNPVKRAKEIAKCSGLPTEVLFYKELNLYDAFHLEKKLHRILKNSQQKDIEFSGHTECFILEPETIPDIMFSIFYYRGYYSE